jgi:hypothetical protein
VMNDEPLDTQEQDSSREMLDIEQTSHRQNMADS